MSQGAIKRIVHARNPRRVRRKQPELKVPRIVEVHAPRRRHYGEITDDAAAPDETVDEEAARRARAFIEKELRKAKPPKPPKAKR